MSITHRTKQYSVLELRHTSMNEYMCNRLVSVVLRAQSRSKRVRDNGAYLYTLRKTYKEIKFQVSKVLACNIIISPKSKSIIYTVQIG